MKQEDHNKKINQIIAKCWSNESYRNKFLADPAATLKAESVTTPEGMSVKVFENTNKVFHLVVPAKPTDLSDDDLEQVVGSGCINTSICGPFY